MFSNQQLAVWPKTVDTYGWSAARLAHDSPTGTVVSIARASCRAPSPLISPAPCVSRSYCAPVGSTSGVAVNCSTPLMAFGVSGGFADLMTAASPAVTAEAMLVPVRLA